MKKIKTDVFSQYSNKMSQKINKIMDPKTIEGLDIEEAYKLIMERKGNFSANMREAIIYHMSVKTIKAKEEEK